MVLICVCNDVLCWGFFQIISFIWSKLKKTKPRLSDRLSRLENYKKSGKFYNNLVSFVS